MDSVVAADAIQGSIRQQLDDLYAGAQQRFRTAKALLSKSAPQEGGVEKVEDDSSDSDESVTSQPLSPGGRARRTERKRLKAASKRGLQTEYEPSDGYAAWEAPESIDFYSNTASHCFNVNNKPTRPAPAPIRTAADRVADKKARRKARREEARRRAEELERLEELLRDPNARRLSEEQLLEELKRKELEEEEELERGTLEALKQAQAQRHVLPTAKRGTGL